MDVPLPGYIWVKVAGIRLYSCYLPPSDSKEEFGRSLDTLGDFNAWATK